MDENTTQISSRIHSNAKSVKQIQSDATNGNEMAQNLEKQMNFITGSTEDMGEIVNELKSSSDEINNIIVMVKKIC